MTAFRPYRTSTSVPSDGQSTTGGGSLLAHLVSQGVSLQTQTPQGAMRPFGQDVGTASDDTIGFEDRQES
jgi:hypothetical protein